LTPIEETVGVTLHDLMELLTAFLELKATLL